MKIHLVSLGCARNRVDSEVMLGRLIKSGWVFTQDPGDAETIIINTCSFIQPAVDESIDTVLEMASFKKTGVCKNLVVTGCLPERFREDIAKAFPEVDVFLGTGAYDEILKAAEGTLTTDSGCCLPDPNSTALSTCDVPRIQTSLYFSYLKIAEGCSKHCTYCIIPKLRGKHRSRPLDDIVREAQSLIQSGTKEIVLVAQDTTAYGADLIPSAGFDRLLDRLAGISDNTWLRFLYGHPESMNEPVMSTVSAHDNICSYFDIPVQHASRKMLKKMGRHYAKVNLYELFDKIRDTAPGAALRTTLMVGFPGETDKDFDLLVDFIKKVQFDHIGVFIYSDSDDIPAGKFSNHVPRKTAKKRQDYLMSLQSEISFEKNRNHIGKAYDVLVEKKINETGFTGRTFFQAPEVDGITHIKTRKNNHHAIMPGNFVTVKITEASAYDITGEPV